MTISPPSTWSSLCTLVIISTWNPPFTPCTIIHRHGVCMFVHEGLPHVWDLLIIIILLWLESFAFLIEICLSGHWHSLAVWVCGFLLVLWLPGASELSWQFKVFNSRMGPKLIIITHNMQSYTAPVHVLHVHYTCILYHSFCFHLPNYMYMYM